MSTYPLTIGGQNLPGSRHEILSPYNGEVVGEVDFANAAQMELAIQTAATAAPAMARLAPHARVKILQHMAHGLIRRKEEISRVISQEAGKPIRLAEGEAARAVQTFIEAAEQCKRLQGEYISIDAVASGEGRSGIVRRFPVGPVAAISPFNFPLNLAAHKVAPAIAAGCSVVLKPASQTPLSGIILGQLAEEAGLPQGGLTVTPAPRDVANLLTVDERLKLLTFTGSAEVGWAMKARAGKKRVLLELGGNAAVIVGPDVNLDLVVPRLVGGAFAYAGQICISVQRIIVLDPLGEELLTRLTEATRATKVGDPADPSVLVGPMIDRANQERVLRWIEEARDSGAKVLCGGTAQGTCVTPAVITEADPTLKICAEEAFGPVVVVERVKDWQTAIDHTNASRFGLQGGVFTNDLKAVWQCFEGLAVGGVIHNDCPTFRVDHMPYGGVKDSGTGREGPRYAMEEMSELRLLVLNP